MKKLIILLPLLALCGCAAIREANNRVHSVIGKAVDVAEAAVTNSLGSAEAVAK